MSQIPVRTVLFTSVRAVGRANWTIEACITSLTASPAWQISKMVSLVLYGWFVLGVVWWMHSSDCEDCPGISMLTASVLLLLVARTVITCIISRGLFAPLPFVEEASTPQVEPATRSQIRVLPLVRVRLPPPPLSDASSLRNRQARPENCVRAACLTSESCAVCLCDFEPEQLARRLPCGHHFHHGCIERWLLQNKRCPLCMHPIDKVCEIPRPKTH